MKQGGSASKRVRGDGTGKRPRSIVEPNEVLPVKADHDGRGPGRPRAKHSDKVNYAQMSLYIRRDIRNRTKVRLFEQGAEFSTLVETLLEAWLKEQDQRAAAK